MTVVDANVVLRRLRFGSPDATAVLRQDNLSAPALLVAETANGLANYVHFEGLERAVAARLLREGLAFRIELVPDRALVVDALEIADELGLTSYDALYVALAERLREPLVTADRRLAERYPRSELIP